MNHLLIRKFSGFVLLTDACTRLTANLEAAILPYVKIVEKKIY